MIYKEFNSCPNEQYDGLSVLGKILANRGIPLDDIGLWISAGYAQILSPTLFGKDKVKNAINLINNALLSRKDIYVVVDCDADGYTSAALIINYITRIMGEGYCRTYIHYIMHTGKQHGLEDTVEQIPDNCLVIIPDAATNDVNEMQQLLNRNC